jgi:Tol biopolymer transport system component
MLRLIMAEIGSVRSGAARAPITVVVVLTAVAIASLPLELPAQTHARSVPTLEPQLTRLYGSDSLNLWHPSSQAALSPDGRWVVFNTVEGADRMNLWIASLEDGQAMRLTDGPEFDGQPRWFPSGDRIAFRSSRFAPGPSPVVHIVSLGIDPQTGRPTGPVRQITLEPTWGNGYAVSPDGKWIAYTTDKGLSAPGVARVSHSTLRVLPATGGAARTLVERFVVFSPTWSADGQSVYFATRRDDYSGPRGPDLRSPAIVMRVWVADGRTEEVVGWPKAEVSAIRISPGGSHTCRSVSGHYEFGAIDGRLLARFQLPQGLSLGGFASSGGTFLATMQSTVAPLRVLPVGGGPARQLNEARSWDWPWGWTTDGTQVLFGTQLNSEDILMRVPIDGGPMRQVPLPDEEPAKGWDPVLSADGRHLFYATSEDGQEKPIAKILDTETGRVREVSRALWDEYKRYNLVDGGEQFLYAEDHGDRVELRAIYPTGPSRLLRSFAPEEFPNGFAVHGDRIAFTRRSGDETSLYIAVAGRDEVRKVLTRRGQIAGNNMWRPEWSRDGSMLALSYTESPPGLPVHVEGFDVMLLKLTADGELVGDPRILTLEPGPRWWYALQWLPDASAFLVLGMGAGSGIIDTDIWLVSLDPDVAPVALTADDPGSVWHFELSPDGRYVAYSSETPLGGSIWKVELEWEW